MNADWIQKYPKAAALLQGADDALDYAPDGCADDLSRRMSLAVQRLFRQIVVPPLPLQPLRQGDPYIVPGIVGADGRYQLFLWDPPDHHEARASRPCADSEARARLEAFLLAHGAVSLPLMVVARACGRHWRHGRAVPLVSYTPTYHGARDLALTCETDAPAAVCTCGMYALRWEP